MRKMLLLKTFYYTLFAYAFSGWRTLSARQNILLVSVYSSSSGYFFLSYISM